MGEVNHSGVVFDERKWSFENLVSEIAEGLQDNTSSFQEEDQFLRGDSGQTSPLLSGSQIVHQIFLFFSIKKTDGHIADVSDLLDVELYNDNFKMFNQAWAPTGSEEKAKMVDLGQQKIVLERWTMFF